MEFDTTQKRVIREFNKATTEYVRELNQLSRAIHYYDRDIQDYIDDIKFKMMVLIHDSKLTDLLDKYEARKKTTEI